MLRIKLTAIAVVSVALFSSVYGQQYGYDENCQILEGGGVKVDQCDTSKFLACTGGRCQCSDPANQVFTYRNEKINSRSRRSPGKKGGGGFKKVAAGAVAGAATYHIASQAVKGGSISFTTTPPPPKYRKVYSCYSRAGGECGLHNNWESVPSDPTTAPATSSAAPEATTVASNTTTTSATNETTTASADSTTLPPTNGTTTTAGPVAAAQTQPRKDISKIPPCVQYAVCRARTPPSANGTSGFHHKVDFDPRIGMCECDSGYEKNNRDLCVRKERNGAGKTAGASMVVILSTLIASKMFA